MSPRILRLELGMLWRERSTWALLALFSFSLLYGLWTGARMAERQKELHTRLALEESSYYVQVEQALASQMLDPRALAGRAALAFLPPAPLPLLAIGQSDLKPSYEFVSLWNPQSTGFRAELENPALLQSGRFDLAFVLVWLFPLILLALVYDLVAGDRESGTLRMALAQGVAPWRWMLGRALVRSAPVLALALLAVLASSGLSGASASALDICFAALLVLAYGLFWIALALWVNTLARNAAAAAAALGAAWVLFVLVMPTLLNLAVESLHPTPSRPELVASARRASGEAERRGVELLTSFYDLHPELAPPGMRADRAQQILTVQDEVQRAVDPVVARFDEQLARQQAAVGTWRVVSPAIAVQEALTDLAGTGYWRYHAFREQVKQLRREVADFYGPRIHRNEPIRRADLERLPRFAFREEAAGVRLGRVGSAVLLVLVLALSFGAWSWARSRRELAQVAPA